MYIIASLFFVAGITAGGVYGFMAKETVMNIIFLSTIGGFAGSSAGGIVFTYLYLTGKDEDTIDEQKKQESDKKKIKRLKKEIKKLKKNIKKTAKT